MEPVATNAGVYVNFSATRGRRGSAPPDPGQPGTRLIEAKRRHDPTNLFRLKQNLPPAIKPHEHEGTTAVPRSGT
jgi:Berberine and berberine like